MGLAPQVFEQDVGLLSAQVRAHGAICTGRLHHHVGGLLSLGQHGQARSKTQSAGALARHFKQPGARANLGLGKAPRQQRGEVAPVNQNVSREGGILGAGGAQQDEFGHTLWRGGAGPFALTCKSIPGGAGRTRLGACVQARKGSDGQSGQTCSEVEGVHWLVLN